MLKILPLLFSTILTGCVSSQSISNVGNIPLINMGDIEPKNLRVIPFDKESTVGYRLQTDEVDYDVVVSAKCESNNRTYSFHFSDKITNEESRHAQWSFFFNGERLGTSSKKFTEKQFLHLAQDIKVAKYNAGSFDRKVNLTSLEVMNLPSRCEDKYSEIQKSIIKRNQEIAEENAALIASVTKSTGLEPMFNGDNQKTFNELIDELKSNGISQFENKFVWIKDYNFKVKQVVDKHIMLRGLNLQQLPVIIISDLPAIEGQYWHQVSRAPLKFLGVTNYTTALGVKKQALLFKLL